MLTIIRFQIVSRAGSIASSYSATPMFEGAFHAAAATGRVSALIPIRNSLINRYPKRIADLAIKESAAINV
jgi:hypothetical protein